MAINSGIGPNLSVSSGLYDEGPDWSVAPSVPTVAGPSGISAGGMTTQTIGNNLANLSQLYGLSQGTGAASGAGQVANLDTALPGAQSSLEQLLSLANTDLSGKLDPATTNNIEQAAAERGVATGDIGGPNANAALLAAMGETTQSLEQTGAQDLATAIGEAPTGPAFNPASQQLTPEQALQNQTQQEQMQQQANEQNAALQAAQAGLKSGGAPYVGGGQPSPGAPTSGYDAGLGLDLYSPSNYSGLVSGTGAPAAAGSLAGAFGMTDNGNGTMTDEYGITYDASTGIPLSADTGEEAASNQAAGEEEAAAPAPEEYDYSVMD